MCGRYFLDTLPEELADHFSITTVPSFEKRYNVAPTDLMPIVVEKDGDRRMGPARWGLIPFWAKDEKIGYKTINARAESLADKPAFREAWKRRRCLVPASGFYEWRREGGQKQPYAIRPPDGRLIAFGGLWERWKNPDGETVISFSIVTTDANRKLAPLHDRMPVILAPDRYGAWLTADDPSTLRDDLTPAPDDALAFQPVSREVNTPRNDHPGLLEPINAA